MNTGEMIRLHCKTLRLPTLATTFEEGVLRVEREEWPLDVFLSYLLEQEAEARRLRRIARLQTQSKLPPGKTFAAFDESRLPLRIRRQLPHLQEGAFVNRAQNVLYFGLPGTGKSHLAQALTHEACRQGFSALFTNTHEMLRHIHGGRADDSIARRIKQYCRPDLLVLDDFGLKPLTPSMPEDLYDIINERYERGSIMLTSNRSPSEWPGLFGNPLLAAAGLDRRAHHAEILVIQGDSFRARGRQRLEEEGKSGIAN
ncbi:MAG: ATP-binding protein [Chloroflexi bacterium]|nr:ATP-binding protein [Chloroflexota bacterium]